MFQDEAYNVIIKKPASEGMEQAPAVILQGHLDMVCEKNADVDFDFKTQGLKLAVDGDYIHACGTTLGGMMQLRWLIAWQFWMMIPLCIRRWKFYLQLRKKQEWMVLSIWIVRCLVPNI